MRESHIEKGLEPPRIGPFKLTGQILRQEGIGGLFHGLKPTFMREMPGYFFFFFAYEFTRELLTPEGIKMRNNFYNSSFYRVAYFRQNQRRNRPITNDCLWWNGWSDLMDSHFPGRCYQKSTTGSEINRTLY